MDYNNNSDLASLGKERMHQSISNNYGNSTSNGNTEFDSKVSLVDFFVGTFKIIFFIVPVTLKALEFVLGLFVGKRK